MSQLVYEYACLPPETGAKEAIEQLWRAHRYRNKLIELERSRRATRDPLKFAAPTELEAQVTALQAEADEIMSDLKAARKAKRGRVPADDAQKDRLREIRTGIKALRPATAQVRKDNVDANRDAIAAVDEAFYASQRAARKMSGCFWGTYLVVEAAHEASAKACEKETWRSDRPLEEPVLPRFLRWDGTGTLAVQLQNVVGDSRRAGLPADRVMGGTDTRFRISAEQIPVDRKRRSYHRAWLRIGSDGRNPIWAVFPVRIHRPLPDNGILTWAKVIRKRVASHYKWCLQVTMDIPESFPASSRDACGINLGWRRMDDGSIRVAYLAGSDGHTEELRLPARFVGAQQKAEDLASIRRKAFNQKRAQLAEWMRGREVSKWFADAAKTLPQWNSIVRLVALIFRWRSNRFAGDEEMFAVMEAWRQHDKHLWLFEANSLHNALGLRRDLYRKFARRVADRYGFVALEDTDLRVFARRARVEQEEDQKQTQRWQRKVACLSQLRACITHAVAGAGGVSHREDASHITQTCSVCGHVEAFDAEREMVHTWGCGHTHDIDQSAARNLLIRASGEGVAASQPVLASA